MGTWAANLSTSSDMKAIVTIKDGNKAEKNFCRDLDITPEEYEILNEAFLHIRQQTGQEFASVYIHEI